MNAARRGRRRVVTALLFVAALAAGVALPSAAEDSPDAATVDSLALDRLPESAQRLKGPRLPGAAVVVFNRPIVRFRAPFLDRSPEERAVVAQKRVKALLAGPGPKKVTVEPAKIGAVVKIDGSVAFAVLDADVDRLGEVAVIAVANDARRSLELVIAEMAEAKDSTALLKAAGWSAGATAIFVAVVAALLAFVRVARRWLVRYAESKRAALHEVGADIVPQDRVAGAIRIFVRTAFWVVVALATYEWLGFLFSQFPFTRPWGEGLSAFLVDTVTGMFEAVADSIPGLVVAVLIFLIARFADRTTRALFDGVQQGRTRLSWLDPDTARPTRRLVTIAIWLFAIAMAYPYIPGAQTDAFKGLSVLLGLMVSVGASGIVGQAASGLILMYTRTYRPGEFVRVADQEGTIVGLGLFTTRVRTGMGEELTLPNSMVLASVTKNYSRAIRGQGFVVDVSATIGYDTPWRQVHAMLVEAARRTEGVVSDPAPTVFQTALSDFYVEYKLVCQALPSEPRPRAVVQSTLHANVQDVFNEHGVQIMSPHYLGDPSQPKVVPKADWYASPAQPPQR